MTELLKKYINYVQSVEGTDFISSHYVDGSIRPNTDLDDFFSLEEIKTLFGLSQDALQSPTNDR